MSTVGKIDREGDREHLEWRGDDVLSQVVKEGITKQWCLVKV